MLQCDYNRKMNGLIVRTSNHVQWITKDNKENKINTGTKGSLQFEVVETIIVSFCAIILL